MYEFDSRVRYSEIGKDGKLKLEAILNYFQDCTIFHSESIGYGIDFLASEKRVWVLLSWQIVVERYPKYGEKIKIATKAYDFKRAFGYRNFMMYDESGACVAYANSVWIYMDAEKMVPLRVNPEHAQKYQIEEKLPMEYADMKIVIPEVEPMSCPSYYVQNYQIDTNGHMNNAQYLNMAYAVVEEEIHVKQMRAEYKKSAMAGDTIYPTVYKERNRYVVTLNNEENKAFAVIEFLLA
jgi:acyl-ACP thioesterase